MNNIISLLTERYPGAEERIEGRLIFLTSYGVTKLELPTLQRTTRLEFYKAKFSTGYRKFSIIDVVVGLSNETNQIYLLTNPIFSERYSSLVEQFEKIKARDTSKTLLNEIVDLFKETGVDITEITASNNKYQLWFGDDMWRVMTFKIDNTLKIKTKPNSFITRSVYKLFGHTLG